MTLSDSLPIVFILFIAPILNTACQFHESKQNFKETVGGNNGDPQERMQQITPFAGESDIDYCISVGSDVTNDKQTLITAIDDAFSVWNQFIKDKGINEALVKSGGFALPTLFTHRDKCSNNTIRFHFGAAGDDADLAKDLSRSRDSAITAIFDRESSAKKRPVLWLAGPETIPQPTLNSFNSDVSLINFSNREEVGAVLRYLVGRLLGNAKTPGSILEFAPEQLIACYRNGVELCLNRVNNKIIEDQYQLVTTDSSGSGKIDGCFLGFGPVTMAVNENSYKIDPESPIWSSEWLSNAAMRSLGKIEVFAQGEKSHLFFERKAASGFRVKENPETSNPLYERLSINWDNSRASLSLRCSDDYESLFFAGKDKCKDKWNRSAARAALTAFLKRCH